MKVRHFIIAFFWVVVTLCSCNRQRVYENYYSMGREGWIIDSIARFQFTIPDNKSVYSFFIDSRNLESYPYSNLWLYLKIQGPDESVIRDTVEIQLAYPNGKWMGKGTSGVYYTEYEYRNNIYFPVPGEYKVSIRHAMRPDDLKGMKDIGIRLEKRK